MQCKTEGQEIPYRKVTYLNWAAPPYAYACGCVLAFADKRLNNNKTNGLLYLITMPTPLCKYRQMEKKYTMTDVIIELTLPQAYIPI